MNNPTKEEKIRDLKQELSAVCFAAIDGGYKPNKKKIDEICQLIENQPGVDEEWIADKLGNLYVSFGLETRQDAFNKFKKYLQEAGIRIKPEKKEKK